MIDSSTSATHNTVMVRCLPRTSTELLLLLELNHYELRQDPWNPVPHILCAVERGEHVFLCMQRLTEFNQPPFKTVANYIDFFRQCLEVCFVCLHPKMSIYRRYLQGLTFMHELEIGQLSFLDPSAFMVDIGVGTPVDQFDRARYPVKYYYTGTSNATKCSSTPPFLKDVQDCGMMIDKLLTNVRLLYLYLLSSSLTRLLKRYLSLAQNLKHS